ncbi:N-acetylglucosamine kinase [Pseudactinotalea sp. HY158]|uniref:N-acetylglucosamine kinase n=1 Tax=Pseudactinotalea sp. HY158 TaxID=2654547 RepID=UPI00129CBEDC|nr:BadF/BadG/BcrA/BcrD ATPase family protein [Pseudactinotalea sp. HY158]QGH68951.1 ATPase [Pseudactinotalea sp. HY158]
MTPTVLAVDLGKTRCRLLLTPTGARPVGTTVDGDLGIAAPGASARIADLIVSAYEGLREVAAPTAVSVGAAGVLAAPESGSDLARALAGRFRCPVAVASDAITAHLGAFGGGPGVVLIAGTGATAVGVAATGRVRVVDGAGPEIGDLGSGGWLGRQGAMAAVRAAQGAAPPTAVTELVAAAIPGGLPALPRWSMGGEGDSPARRLATFAPLVLAAAEDGDRTAIGLVDLAVGHLSASARAAAPDEPGCPVAVVGGVADAPWFAARLEAGLRDSGLTPRPPAGTALDGALLAASHTTLPHERRIHRA